MIDYFNPQIIKGRKEEMLKNKPHHKNEGDKSKDLKKKKAFLDLLLEEHINNNSLTMEDIEEEVQTFLFAGHDTTSVGNGWTLYFLGRHPEILKKVQEEVDSVLGEDHTAPITTDQLKNLRYTEQVIKESNRLCPPVPHIGRKVNEAFTLGKYQVPKNSTLVVFIMALHRNEKCFPNPEIFDPDRFNEENAANRNPFSYIPFSAGSRNCIGQRIAMMGQKMAIANVVRRFNIESRDPFDKLLIGSEVVLAVHPDGLQMKATRR